MREAIKLTGRRAGVLFWNSRGIHAGYIYSVHAEGEVGTMVKWGSADRNIPPKWHDPSYPAPYAIAVNKA